MFSSRIPNNLEPNKLSQVIAEVRGSGRPLLDLTVSNPTTVGLDYPFQEIEKISGSADLFPYEPHPRGAMAAREAIAALASKGGVSIDPEHLWLTSGTSEAYAFLLKLLAEPGEEVAIPAPGYPLFRHLLELEGVRPVPYPLRYAEGWFIDFKMLEKVLSPRTRVLIVVNPNNPTGHFVRSSEMEDLLSLCEKRKLALIVDEVFLEFPLESSLKRVSFARAQLPILTFVLDGLSKRFGLPQLKLSWMSLHGPEALVREAGDKLDWISDLYLSVGTPIQGAVPKLAQLASALTSMIRERVLENHRFLVDRFGPGEAVRYLPSQGGWSGILLLPERLDEEKSLMELARREGVLVHPGYFFDLPFRSSFVVSLLPESGGFKEGMKKARAFVRRAP